MRHRSSSEWNRMAYVRLGALAILCGSLPTALAQPKLHLPSEKPAVKDRDALSADTKRLWSESQRLDKEGKLDEAIAAGERCLAAQQTLLGSSHPTYLQ